VIILLKNVNKVKNVLLLLMNVINNIMIQKDQRNKNFKILRNVFQLMKLYQIILNAQKHAMLVNLLH